MIGVQIIESLSMVDYVEDWSRVRSPGRAARRRRQGHRQNIEVRAVPRMEALSMDGGRTIVVHPEVGREMRRWISERLS